MALSARKARNDVNTINLAQHASITKRPRNSRKSSPLNYLHAAARTYHDLGLPITICRGKAPWQDGWPVLNWAPHTIDAAYKLNPAANVGLVLGPRSGLVDFECDGPEAEQTLLDLFNGEIPETPTWRARRGLHRLFQLHHSLLQLGKNKLTIGGDGAKVEILIGPGAQTLLPPSWADGVQREWVLGDSLLPSQAATIPDGVLRRLGCDQPDWHVTEQDTEAVSTDSNPTSVVSVVSVVSVSKLDDPTAQRIMAAVVRCLVLAKGTTNDKFMALAIALKGLPELAGTMGEDLEPYIGYWYEQSLPFMKVQNWQEVWERWLYLWIWAKPGHDTVRLAFEASQQEPMPQCAFQYPIQPMRQLVALCRILHRQHADDEGRWYLACRSAAEVIGFGHVFVAKLLKRLVEDGILYIAEQNTIVRATRYRYLGD
jgi:hypothetical protein